MGELTAFTRLSHPADKQAFRQWFCYLAESQTFAAPQPEVRDCAALLRFAYREALRKHDAAWARGLGLSSLPPYSSPPSGVSPLFATANGQKIHFADAQTLKQYNTTFVARDWRAATPGDLFFYLQLEQNQPFHAMVFLGPSSWQREDSSRRYAIYHTGSIGNGAGEIRRPEIHELLSHPDPRWRPVAGNAAFLGVHRWRILD